MIRGDNVLKEYHKDPEITAQALEPDGWFHTGDLGYMDEDGFVFVTGRLKELIIKGGENISPREIDECLYGHPDVLDAAAVGIPDEHYGEEIMVCCTLKAGAACPKISCMSIVSSIWASTKLPRSSSCWTTFPRVLRERSSGSDFQPW